MATIKLKLGHSATWKRRWHLIAAFHQTNRIARSQTSQLDGSMKTPDGTLMAVFAARQRG